MQGPQRILQWAKRLATRQTAPFPAIGAGPEPSPHVLPRQAKPLLRRRVKPLWTSAIFSFVISIAAALLLLLSIPEASQNATGNPDGLVKTVGAMGRVSGWTIDGLVVVEICSFGLGLVLIVILVVGGTPSPAPKPQ